MNQSKDTNPALNENDVVWNITEVSVHRRRDNPIFGDSTTKVRVEDEGAGAFIVLTQSSEDSEGKLRFDPDELEEILAQARKMIAAYPAKENK